VSIFSYEASGKDSIRLNGVIVASSETQARELLTDRDELDVQAIVRDDAGLDRIVIDALCCVMAADGTASRIEKQHICDAMADWSPSYPREDVIRSIQSFMQHMKHSGYARRLEATLHDAGELKVQGKHQQLLHALTAVAASDGVFAKRERKVIERFRGRVESSLESRSAREPGQDTGKSTMSINLQPGEELIQKASFDPAWKTYTIVNNIIGIGVLAVVFGIPAVLAASEDFDIGAGGVVFWGMIVAVVLFVPSAILTPIRFRNLECYLTSRALIVRSGVFNKSEKTIPLTRIQDLSMTQGPLMRAIGIHNLKIETAGQSTQGGAGEAALLAVVDAPAFRDRVRRLRNSLETETPGDRDGLGHTGPRRATDLSDIHETLKRIERHLERMADNES
jgi:putative membrane protein